MSPGTGGPRRPCPHENKKKSPSNPLAWWPDRKGCPLSRCGCGWGAAEDQTECCTKTQTPNTPSTLPPTWSSHPGICVSWWKWKLLSCVRLFVILLAILQARILEWVAFPFSRGSSQPSDRTQVSRIAGGFFTSRATREAQEYWSGEPIPSPADLPDPGIELGSPVLQASYEGSPLMC